MSGVPIGSRAFVRSHVRSALETKLSDMLSYRTKLFKFKLLQSAMFRRNQAPWNALRTTQKRPTIGERRDAEEGFNFGLFSGD